ncbi:hypothetical protein KO361_03100 [Candidatus Woesearchaeota archaeon]|nr:hypothetical protein [Candidatus Woesearchaeota archaeon]
MGFISFNLDYYQNNIQELESSPFTEERLYKAKQLLKMLDDLQDEGYSYLRIQLEEKFSGITKLRHYLADNNATPFEISPRIVDTNELIYSGDRFELEAILRKIDNEIQPQPIKEPHPFIEELITFCEWVGYEEDTAYIFLLRDTLLPYLYFSRKGRNPIYPWLMGRKMLEKLTGEEDVDEAIRDPLLEALEEANVKTFRELCDFSFPRIRKNLEKYPVVTTTVKNLLGQIQEKRIIVIESGCYGTFPMLLSCFDPRVEFRMYTAVPYLTDIYSDRLFTRAYEKIRLFETLYSQDMYFRLADFADNRFFVEICTDKTVEEKALDEIRQMLF